MLDKQRPRIRELPDEQPGSTGRSSFPIRYLVLGTIYPQAIPLGKPERISYPLISYYGHPHTMMEFYTAHQIAWYTEDKPEEIESFFLSRGWQNYGIQGNDPAHFYKDPTSSWNFGPLTIRVGGWIWVKYGTATGQVNGKTSSSIFVWLTLDNQYSLK
jgi:hypothetical protein